MNPNKPSIQAPVIAKAHPLYARIWVRASVLAPHAEWPVPTVARALFTNNALSVHHDPDEQARVAQQQMVIMTTNPERFAEGNRSLQQACVELEQTMHLMPQEGLSSASDQDLWSYFDKHEQVHSLCAQWGWTSVFAEQSHEAFSGAIRDWIRRQIEPGTDRGRVFSLLMLSDKLSIAEQDQYAFWDLAKGYDIGALTNSTWANRVQALNAKTCFVGLLDGEPIKSFAQTVEDIQRIRQSIPHIEKHIEAVATQREQDLLERAGLMQTLGFTARECAFIDAYRDALWLKGYRRRAQQYALYRLEPILDDMARRLGIESSLIRYLSPEEIRDALLYRQALPQDLPARAKACRYIADQEGHRFEVDGATSIIEIPAQSVAAPTQLRGMTASRGYATGLTYVVTQEGDMAGMPDKAILVINQARPEYTELFARAAAVVCDQGGVTSHAAIIAREYGVPCIVATKQATQCFPTGMVVEVDADRAEIRLLC